MKINRRHVAGLALSAVAMIGIANHEGFRSRAYDDGVGVQTIGFGTTAGVKKGDTITVERALIRLGQDVGRFEQEMRRCIGDVPLYQHEWDAYVSLAYNIGYGGFCCSTIVKRLKQNPPDYNEACQAILLWNKAGGKVWPGLVKRRQAEYRQCMGEK
jgi:lysozyme